MQLSEDDVRHLAHLARLGLSDEEVTRYTGQLTDILSWAEMIQEAPTDGVPETSQVTGLSTVLREDEVKQDHATPDELLETSPLEKMDHQIRIKRIM